MNITTNPDADAVPAGTEVELPATQLPSQAPISRTDNDEGPTEAGGPAPLTTDPEAQDLNSIINPGSS